MLWITKSSELSSDFIDLYLLSLVTKNLLFQSLLVFLQFLHRKDHCKRLCGRKTLTGLVHDNKITTKCHRGELPIRISWKAGTDTT